MCQAQKLKKTSGWLFEVGRLLLSGTVDKDHER
jgi:hypothetical protein